MYNLFINFLYLCTIVDKLNLYEVFECQESFGGLEKLAAAVGEG